MRPPLPVALAAVLAAPLLAAPAALADPGGGGGGPPGAPAGEMVRLEAGRFPLGDAAGEPDERPARTVRLAAFYLDRLEVTQRGYARCVAARACTPPRPGLGAVGPDLPVVGVTWHQAAGYCRWAGKRLPSEAEWERAARGGEGRTYPWGEELSCARANFGNYRGAGLCGTRNPGRVLPGGSRPTGATPEGLQDLGGNVWEWTADDYRPYPGGAGRGGARLKVLRGGACCSYFVMPRAANRLAFPADYADEDIGLRCARDAGRGGAR